MGKTVQGVVVKLGQYGPTSYFVLWSREVGFSYAKTSNISPKYLFEVAPGNWLEYNIEARNEPGIENIMTEAYDLRVPEKSNNQSPATDEFRGPVEMHKGSVRVKYFEPVGNTILFKTSVNLLPGSRYEAEEEFVGHVNVDSRSYRLLVDTGVYGFDAVLELCAVSAMGFQPHWKVLHFVFEGKQYSLNGYLSKRGKMLRGPGGKMVPRNLVCIPPDSLHPIRQDEPQKPWGGLQPVIDQNDGSEEKWP